MILSSGDIAASGLIEARVDPGQRQREHGDAQSERDRHSDKRRGEAWEFFEEAHESGLPENERDINVEPLKERCLTAVKPEIYQPGPKKAATGVTR